MIKRIIIIVSMLIMLLSSSFASENAHFFGGDPIVTFDGSTGIGDIEFSVATDNFNLMKSEIYIYRTGETPILVNEVTGLGSRELVSYNINISSIVELNNYNGEYNYRVELYNEDDLLEFDGTSLDQGVLGTYTGGVENVESTSISSLSDLIGTLFIVLGTLIAGVVTLITGDLLILVILGAVVTFIVGIIYLLKQRIVGTIKK